MVAVCRLDHWSEVIAANPQVKDQLMAFDPYDFIARMTRWRRSFVAGSEHPVIGLSAAQLRSLTMPACICPGNDPVHPREPGQAAHRLMPNAELHQIVTDDHPDLDAAFAAWDSKEGLLAATFIDFLRRQARR